MEPVRPFPRPGSPGLCRRCRATRVHRFCSTCGAAATWTAGGNTVRAAWRRLASVDPRHYLLLATDAGLLLGCVQLAMIDNVGAILGAVFAAVGFAVLAVVTLLLWIGTIQLPEREEQR